MVCVFGHIKSEASSSHAPRGELPDNGDARTGDEVPELPADPEISQQDCPKCNSLSQRGFSKIDQ